ncbi:TPA: UDP-glucose 4-epimerase [Neisseria meningitidis]
MKNILVTGGTGFIGSHTVVSLLKSGHQVVILDNLCNSSINILPRLKTITGQEIPFYQGDIRDREILRRIFAENRIDSVIHFAGLKAVGESGLIGEQPNGIPNNLLPYICQVAAGKLPQLAVFGDDYPTPDGTGMRDYIHVMDLAEGHVAAMQAKSNVAGTHLLNLGSGRASSVLEIIRAFEAASGLTIPYEVKPRRAGDLACFYADPSYTKAQIGWQTQRDLTQMMEDSWRWVSNNPNGYDD